MADILHRVGVRRPPQDVYDALATVKGLRGWWVSDANGDAGAGGIVDFGFCRMAVEEAVPGARIRWRCIDGPGEWVGTTVSFRLDWRDPQTFVLFSHAGWRDPGEFMHHCSTKWAVFLLSLRDLLEKGRGHPAPDDEKIHVGD